MPKSLLLPSLPLRGGRTLIFLVFTFGILLSNLKSLWLSKKLKIVLSSSSSSSALNIDFIFSMWRRYTFLTVDMSSFVAPIDRSTLEIVLKPMQIRTFQVTLKWCISIWERTVSFIREIHRFFFILCYSEEHSSMHIISMLLFVMQCHADVNVF